MPRHPRLFVRGYPHHIVHRGHDRQPVFMDDADYITYLANLVECLGTFDIALLAYCLMVNHVHLLLLPRADPGNISRLMRVVAARQTRHVNRLEGRTGTLWESRFKASLVDSDGYLLACCRYIELNPLRAHMVEHPEDYRWSSFRQRVGLTSESMPLAALDYFNSSDESSTPVQQRYRAFVENGLPEDEARLIRTAVNRNQVTGSGPFRGALERKLGRRLPSLGPGRPTRKQIRHF